MSTADFLFGGTTPSSFTNQSVSTSSLPDWYQEAIKGVIGQASALAAQPYPMYQGPRVAGQNQYQTQAADLAATNPAQTQGALDTAQNYISHGAGDFDENQFKSYLNPLLEGANGQLDTIAKLGTRNLNESILPGISQSFISNGMFGSKNRLNDVTSRALRDANESILNQQSGIIGNAYNTAMTNYGNAQNRNIQAGSLQTGLAGVMNNTANSNISNLNTVGGALQTLQQENLNAAHNDFVEQRDYPMTQLSNLQNAIRGYQMPTTNVTNTTSPLQQGTIGTAGGAQSALSGLGSFLGL